MSAAAAIEGLKQSIEKGVRVLGAIAEKHDCLGADIDLVIQDVADLVEYGKFDQARKWVWKNVNVFGEQASGSDIATAFELLGSVNGHLPELKAEAVKFLSGAQDDFDIRRYGDASFKARKACGILRTVISRERQMEAGAEFAQSLRLAHRINTEERSKLERVGKRRRNR